MHEASLMNSLMAKIDEIAAREKADRVSAVEVWLGALSHMTPEHFREHFDIAAKGSIAEGATLITEVSEDIHDSNAETILLKSIETEG